MDLVIDKINLSFTIKEATALAKILGSLTTDATLKLGSSICPIDREDDSIRSDIYCKLSNFLLTYNGGSFEKTFNSKVHE